MAKSNEEFASGSRSDGEKEKEHNLLHAEGDDLVTGSFVGRGLEGNLSQQEKETLEEGKAELRSALTPTNLSALEKWIREKLETARANAPKDNQPPSFVHSAYSSEGLSEEGGSSDLGYEQNPDGIAYEAIYEEEGVNPGQPKPITITTNAQENTTNAFSFWQQLVKSQETQHNGEKEWQR